MSHRNAPLTPAGRLRLVQRCSYRPIAHVAAEAGVSRQCLSKWVGRYRHDGEAGLNDRSSAPSRRPTQLDPQIVAEIERLRRTRKWSARLIAVELNEGGHCISAATVGRWLVRLGLNRRRWLDVDGEPLRTPAKIVARYRGHMIHLDVKKVGRIPDGGGWRVHGRDSNQHRANDRAKAAGARAGYIYLHSAIDGFSRLAYTEHLHDETGKTAAGFWARARVFFAAHGITAITRVVTDIQAWWCPEGPRVVRRRCEDRWVRHPLIVVASPIGAHATPCLLITLVSGASCRRKAALLGTW